MRQELQAAALLMLSRAEYDDVIVTIAHPCGDIDSPLPEWIRVGPGPRPYVQLVRARRRSTGDPVPLDEIPAEYHNSPRTRGLQREGRLPCPWGPPPAAEP